MRLTQADKDDRPATKFNVATSWSNGVKYWADLYWTTKEAKLQFHAWDREYPIAVLKVRRGDVWGVYSGIHWEEVMSFLKRASAADQSKRQASQEKSAEWSLRHPALSEHLTATTYPDGGQRTTSTLLLFFDDGVWKACLKDRDQGRSLWHSTDSPGAILDELEALLQGEDQEWRKDREWSPTGGQKKKK